MTHRKNFHKEHLDKKIRVKSKIYLFLTLLLFGIVIHDSYVHDLPFHHILYGLAGILAGHAIALSQRIVVANDESKLKLQVHPISKFLTVGLLALRFFAGKIILEEFNVVWVTDAIYLFFIGTYISRIKSTGRQIDEHLYSYFFSNKEPDQKLFIDD